MPAADDSLEILKKKATFIRRTFRVSLLLFFIVGVVVTLIWASTRRFLSERLVLDLQEHIVLEVHQCMLTIKVVRSEHSKAPPLGFAVFTVEAVLPWIGNIGELRVSGTHVTLPNAEVDMEWCLGHLWLNTGASLSSLTLSCTGHCVITSDLSDTGTTVDWWDWQVRGNFSASSESSAKEATIMIEGLDVLGSLTVHNALGDIYLEDVTVGSSSIVTASSGDIYAQLREDVDVTWSESSNFYCLAAPSLGVTEQGDCDTSYVSNGSYSLSRTCAGSAQLWSNDSTATATMTLVAGGSFYLTRHTSGKHDLAVGAGFNETDATSGRYSVAFTPQTLLNLASVRAVMEGDSASNKGFALKGGPNVREARQGHCNRCVSRGLS